MSTVRLTLALLLCACSAETAPPKAPIGRTKPSGRAGPTLPGPPGLPAALVASSERDEAPMAFAHQGDRGLAVFEQGGRLYARAIAAGPQAGQGVDLGAAGAMSGAFSLKAKADGFLLFWNERVDQNSIFKLLDLGADGRPKGAPRSMAPIADAALSYADFVQLGEVGLIVYEIAKGARKSVYVLPVDGAASGPRAVVEDAVAWSAAQTAQGLAFAVARGDAAKPPQRVLTTIEVILVGPDGQPSAPLGVVAKPTAEVDVEIAAVDGALVVAWTDFTDDAGAVRFAVLDASGKLVAAPSLVAPPIGDQALLGLVGQPDGLGKRALVAWENLGQTSGGSRIVHLATVGADGKASKERTRLLLDAQEGPDLVAHESGFAALTLAPARAGEGSASGAPSWPAVVRLGLDLTPKGSEPVRFVGARSSEGVPDAVYGLSCSAGSCFVLGADGTSPVARFIVAAPERTSPWAPAAWRAEDERPPKIDALSTVNDGPKLASAQAARGADGGTLAAWVTFEDGAPEKAPKGEPPFAATLAARSVDPNGALGPVQTISKRALSFGGVAIAPALGARKPESVIAWVASDKGAAQVFVTKLDASGEKLAQKKVTVVERKKKGDKGAEAPSASDVAIAWSPADRTPKGETRGTDGYVVAWVDTRDGDAEVYAARVNKELEKSVVDKRITTAKGTSGEVSLAVRGASAFVAFADARENANADIYFAHLDAITLREIDEDGRVYASAGRSRAPRLSLRGDKIVLVWIEDPPPNERTPSALRIAEVDATGRLVGAPRVISAPEGGSVTAFTFACSAGGWESCRGVVAWAREGGRAELGGLSFDASGTPAPIGRLGSLTSGPFANPSLSLSDASAAELFFIEDTANRGRVRRVKLGW